jgi:fused signal recognition particle receptor
MFRKLTFLSVLLAFCVVAAGAYVRISEAGLGCPDWPGCFGKLTVEAPQPGEPWAGHAFDAAKAWKEMGHRYLAGALGVLVLILAGAVFGLRRDRGKAAALAYGALALTAAQAALGLWAVKLHLLPPVVTAHLLMGLLTLACLYRLFLAVGPQQAPVGDTRGLLWLSRFALLALFVQLFLGGWVSSNYAALACPDFPGCRGSLWPEADYAEGFRLWRSFEPGYQGALLPPAALVAVHWAHRIGAVVAFLALSALALGVTSNPKAPRLSKAGLLLSFLLLVEIGLGIAGVVLRLPLVVEVAHSVCGALLLLNLVHIQYFLGLPRRAAEAPGPAVPAPVPAVAPEALLGELPAQAELAPVLAPPLAPPVVEVPARPTADSLFVRLKSGLGKTRGGLTGFLSNLALGRKAIDRDLLDDIEAQLLTADIGVAATRDIIDHLTDSLDRHQLADLGALTSKLRGYLYAILEPVSVPLDIPPQVRPFVILVVGVNGVGKTTTIGKLARRFQARGHSVMLAAGDTFRAAAVEQLQAWGERSGVTVVAQHTGADSASVIFDAVQAAKARGLDVLIADTAGRLHTKSNLMEELGKIKRIMRRLDDSAPHEALLVVDAGTGQNAINQARQFNDAVGLTGIALTKLDGTAKGGVIFALAKQFGVPIRYIGVGEGIDDLQDFDAEQFVAALFAE